MLEARRSPHPSPKRIRTPSTSMTSWRAAEVLQRLYDHARTSPLRAPRCGARALIRSGETPRLAGRERHIGPRHDIDQVGRHRRARRRSRGIAGPRHPQMCPESSPAIGACSSFIFCFMREWPVIHMMGTASAGCLEHLGESLRALHVEDQLLTGPLPSRTGQARREGG